MDPYTPPVTLPVGWAAVLTDEWDAGFPSSWRRLTTADTLPSGSLQAFRGAGYGNVAVAVDADDADLNVLNLLASRESFDGKAFTSGGIESFGRFPVYGRYEARMRIPHGQGSSPTFHLEHTAGADVALVDIATSRHATAPGWVHWAVNIGGSEVDGGFAAFETPTLTPGWHTFTLDIERTSGTTTAPTQITFKFYVDGTLAHTYTMNSGFTWVTDYVPALDALWKIVVRHDIGGDMVGDPDGILDYLDIPDLCANTLLSAGGDGTTCSPATHTRRINFLDYGSGGITQSLQTGQSASFGTTWFTSIDYVRVFAAPGTLSSVPTTITVTCPAPSVLYADQIWVASGSIGVAGGTSVGVHLTVTNDTGDADLLADMVVFVDGVEHDIVTGDTISLGSLTAGSHLLSIRGQVISSPVVGEQPRLVTTVTADNATTATESRLSTIGDTAGTSFTVSDLHIAFGPPGGMWVATGTITVHGGVTVTATLVDVSGALV